MVTASMRATIGTVLVIAGVGLAIAGAVSMQRTDDRAQAPYRYEPGDTAAPRGDASVQEALARTGADLRKARVVSNSDDSTLAELDIADGTAGPVLLQWRSSLDEPFLTATAPLDEVLSLGEALHKHLPPDAIVLAWWDVSRQLRLLDDTPVRFDRHLVGAPLALPVQWQPARAAIEKVEEHFWAADDVGESPADFNAWVEALLAPRDEGIRRLREQAGGRDVHVVVHVRDALLLGAMAPERIGVAFKDEADTGNMHGSINNARNWVRDEGFTAYTAYRPDNSRLRLVALTDDTSARTLVARLLPFHDPHRQLEQVPGLTLVHQVGGFWVYQLEPDRKS